jgi:hypothetical protein
MPTKPYFARSLLEPAEPLLSQHIQMLELHCMRAALDFWGCPVIVKLVMKDCTTLDDNMTALVEKRPLIPVYKAHLCWL